MKLLVLGTDLLLDDTDNEIAAVRFRILDAATIEKFLGDVVLITFLQDHWTPTAVSGCRLQITRDGDILTIARKIGTNTLASAAGLDLISALKTYVISPSVGRDGDWPAILGGLKVGHCDLDKIPTKVLPRGTALLTRGDEASAPLTSADCRP